jgi:hypothetical protein
MGSDNVPDKRSATAASGDDLPSGVAPLPIMVVIQARPVACPQ